MLQRLWKDDAGFVVSAELILVATIAVIGLVVGLNAVRNSVTNELADVAAAIDSVNQSYTVFGVQGHGAATTGFTFFDRTDYCDVGDTTGDRAAQCIIQGSAAQPENQATSPTQPGI